MSPLEVNKKIAELKGFTAVKQARTSNGLWCSKTILEIDGSFIDACYFNWAEKIANAWQLFEEMPIGFSIMRDKEYNWCLFHNSIWSVAPTAPMAIALAWLKWKESK